jgi:hypothetical protein
MRDEVIPIRSSQVITLGCSEDTLSHTLGFSYAISRMRDDELDVVSREEPVPPPPP